MAETTADFEWPYVHKLKRSVETPGGSVSELSFREPTTNDFLEFGLLNGFDGETIYRLAVKLSGRPEPVLKAIPGVEMMTVVRRLSGFFSEASK